MSASRPSGPLVIRGFLANQDPTVYYAAYVMLHDLVDMIVTCFHMLKIASDGNFYLLLKKTTSI